MALYEEQKNLSLLDNFLNYITESEQQLFTMALEDFNKVNEKDLLEALDNHNCRSVVNKDTLRDILLEVAHKELIQEPKYIVNCWTNVLKDLGSNISREQLKEIYFNMEPTPRKVIKLLQFPEHMS